MGDAAGGGGPGDEPAVGAGDGGGGGGGCGGRKRWKQGPELGTYLALCELSRDVFWCLDCAMVAVALSA
jgi:hypothetical protein